ncbi:trk system potassium uptake protein TrkA [Prauserella aidingensis]|uniref:potassium channel family protein n=1 Tax=Prauserella aidingensis TaxID=387890 RepID=UPI0020A58370|nr:TrkA family potassium uptake protein [Prauserella aidingensis]MCP2254655.1 trk system potassium uptake protein TrkA [Prauserella aidingensis]
MRVAIAGAGAVGRSIASELIEAGHTVLLIERLSRQFTPEVVEAAEWVLGDACEMSTLEASGIERCDVVIAATGDDKANLVLALLAKTEFAVRRVVARVNNPANEWLFNESWGVDVAVSTPRMLAAMVEEAVSVGDLVRLMTFRKSQANLVELTLPEETPLAGTPVERLNLPRDAALVAILRGERVIVPQPDDPVEGGDEVLFVAPETVEPDLRAALGR